MLLPFESQERVQRPTMTRVNFICAGKKKRVDGIASGVDGGLGGGGRERR